MKKKYPINKNLWYLEENLKYLNHASFGATPRVVMERFFELTKQLEMNPMQFYLEDYHTMMNISRKAISQFLGTSSNKIVYVDNATSGVNAVMRSLQRSITEDWEILTFDHYYPAVKNTLTFVSNATGCKIRIAEFPDFVESEEQIISIIKSAITEKTKMLVIDHVSSISAIVLPLKAIIDYCRQNGILILIDGAHAPGYVNLNLDDLNPDFYTGNLHKWLFAPKGTAILYASEAEKHDIHPVTISIEFGNGFTQEFDWVGTRNFCNWLTTPECIGFYNEYFNYEYCRTLSLEVREMLINDAGLKPMSDVNLTSLMHSYWLPERAGSTIQDVLNLRKTLLNNYGIEIFMNPFKGKIVLRTSTQVYNYLDEYKILVGALKEI